jgi:hypothetical protein
MDTTKSRAVGDHRWEANFLVCAKAARWNCPSLRARREPLNPIFTRTLRTWLIRRRQTWFEMLISPIRDSNIVIKRVTCTLKSNRLPPVGATQDFMKHRSPYVTRSHVVKRVEAQLRSTSFPRLQMLLIVALTGGFGLLSSFSMLHFGLDAMAIRYPLALAVAYLFFLSLIWLWMRTKAADFLDAPDVTGLVPRGNSSTGLDQFASGGGGDFGGGGASGSFDSPTVDLGSVDDASTKAVGEAFGAVAEAEEFAVPIVVVALAIGLSIGLLWASIYFVYVAPVLFAEVLVDGALSYALFRHLRAEDRPFWLASAMRHTIVPFALAAVFLAVAGAVMSFYAPGANSIGQVAQHFTAKRAVR